MASPQPLVSVVTPVYNGEPWLRECIESVLAQSYRNWEYIIVNNCSTDRSLDIARQYAKKDGRIQVVCNPAFVGVIENHNNAFARVSPRSAYCKVVSADDWIYPDCLEKLVGLAESNPSVGIVGSHGIDRRGIRWIGLPVDRSTFKGTEVCRLYLLGKIDFFGMPSGSLYRADLLRMERPFYPGTRPNADAAACLETLQHSDFGFVHQVLYFERIHEEAISTRFRDFGIFTLHALQFLKEYGSVFLSPREQAERTSEVLRGYYGMLARAAFAFRGKEFWDYHRNALREIGYPFQPMRLFAMAGGRLLDLLLNPKQAAEKALRRLRARKDGRGSGGREALQGRREES